MKLKDISNGPAWMVWAVIITLAVISAVLLSGRGAGLIAGYNTSSKEKKALYDEKKLCTVVGAGMSVVTVLLLIMKVFEAVLPASFGTFAMGGIIADCTLMVILANTICKR